MGLKTFLGLYLIVDGEVHSSPTYFYLNTSRLWKRTGDTPTFFFAVGFAAVAVAP
jgi:hypothetical protein